MDARQVSDERPGLRAHVPEHPNEPAAVHPALAELQRRALVMRRVRTALAFLLPVEMFLYVPPPGVASPLHPLGASLALVAFLLAVTAASAAVHRDATDLGMLQRWAWGELIADNAAVPGDPLPLRVRPVLLDLDHPGDRRARGRVPRRPAGCGAVLGGERDGLRRDPGHGGRALPRDRPAGRRARSSSAPLSPERSPPSPASSPPSSSRPSSGTAPSEAALAAQYADLQLIGRVSRAIAAGPEARTRSAAPSPSSAAPRS